MLQAHHHVSGPACSVRAQIWPLFLGDYPRHLQLLGPWSRPQMMQNHRGEGMFTWPGEAVCFLAPSFFKILLSLTSLKITGFPIQKMHHGNSHRRSWKLPPHPQSSPYPRATGEVHHPIIEHHFDQFSCCLTLQWNPNSCCFTPYFPASFILAPYVYIYMYIYMCIYIYVYIYIHICICMYQM